MDPSNHYYSSYEHTRPSLASTTDPSRGYMSSISQYPDAATYEPSSPQPHNHYGHQQSRHSPRLDYVQEEHVNSYQSHLATTASASYPGAISQSHGSRPPPVVTAHRSVSNPIIQPYSYGHSPSSYPVQQSQDYRGHVYTSTQNGGTYRSNGSPTMQHAAYPAYPNGSLHPSTHTARRPYPSASPVPIPPASPTGIERYACDNCDKTFSRAHDRKRHFETHHSSQPASHKCPYCRKDFSRADSLKRHCDNGCDKDPNRETS